MPRYNLWAELMEPDEISEAIPYLSKYGFGIAIAFPFETVNRDYEELFIKLFFLKIHTYVWALLPDDLGYWINEGNAQQFAEKAHDLQDWFRRRGIPFNLVADMELPLDQMRLLEKRSLLKFSFAMARNIRRKKFRWARNTFDCVAEMIRAEGGESTAPIPFNLVHELLSGRDLIQDALQTPIAHWDKISPMFYTSLFEKLTGGILKKEDARWYMYRALKEFSEKEKLCASASLGTVGPGKLGTEDSSGYEDPELFAADVRAALAAGIEDVFVFNLAGIMRSPDPESWFRAIRQAEPEIPERTFKGDLLYRMFSLLGKI